MTWSVIRTELQELASKHVVPRRTRIDDSFGDEADSAISEEDLLANDRSVSKREAHRKNLSLSSVFCDVMRDC